MLIPVIIESANPNTIICLNVICFLSGRFTYINIDLSSESSGLTNIIPDIARNDSQKAELTILYGLIQRRITVAMPSVFAPSLVLPSTSASIYTRIIITARLADALYPVIHRYDRIRNVLIHADTILPVFLFRKSYIHIPTSET